MENIEINYVSDTDNLEIPKPKKKLEAPNFKNDDIKYKVSTNKKWSYVIPISLIVVSILLFVVMYLFRVKVLYILIYGIIVFPILFLSGIFLLIRTYLDRRIITGKIIKKLSKNFIIANFYRENRRIYKIVRLINKDGITFKFNKGTYVIDMETIWLDGNNHPNAFYLENIPNPVKFEFQKDITKFIKQTLIPITDEDGEEVKKDNVSVDISFSAENLSLLKKDKIFQELSRNPSNDKMLMISLGLIALSLIAIVLVVIFGSGK